MTWPSGSGKVRYEPEAVAPHLARLLNRGRDGVREFIAANTALLDSYDMDAALLLAGARRTADGVGGLTPGQWFNLGVLRLTRGEAAAAVAALTRAREAGDGAERAAADLWLGIAHEPDDEKAALTAYERAMEAGTQDSRWAAMEAARLLAEREPDRAARILAGACRTEGPHVGPSAYRLGLLLGRLGDAAGAERAFRRAMADGDGEVRAAAANSLGNLLSSAVTDAGSARAEEAIAAYGTAADGDTPGAGEAAVNLGLLLARLGRTEEALAAYHAAAEGPDVEQHARALTNIGELLFREARTAESEAVLRRAVALRHPFHSYRARFDLGVVLDALHRFEEARRQWEQCLDGPPEIAEPARRRLAEPHGVPTDSAAGPGARARELAAQLLSAPTWSDMLDLVLAEPDALAAASAELAQLVRRFEAEAPEESLEGLKATLRAVQLVRELGTLPAFAELSGYRGVVDDDIAVLAMRLRDYVHLHRTVGTRAEDAARTADLLLTHPSWPRLPPVFTAWALPLMTEAVTASGLPQHTARLGLLVDGMRAAVATAPPEQAPELSYVLASMLLLHSPTADEADEAVRLLEPVAEATTDPAASAVYRSCLAEAMAVRARTAPDGHRELTRAIGLAQSAVDALERLGEPAAPDLLAARLRLMGLLHRDFEATEARESADRAAALGRDLLRGDIGGQRLGVLHDLARLLIDCNDEAGLAEAVPLLSEALDLAPSGTARHLVLAHMLGLLLTDASLHPGPGGAHARQAVRIAELLEGDGVAGTVPELVGASADLRRRLYERTGDRTHLDIAVATTEAVLRDATGERVVRATTTLAELLRLLYQATGRVAHVRRAVALLRGVRDARPAPERDQEAVALLGEALVSLSEASGDLAYLDEAVGVLGEAHGEAQGRGAHGQQVARSLAAALENRGGRLHAPEDVDGAVGLYRELRDRTDPRSALRPHAEGDVGTVLLRRYGLSGDPADLDEAITCLRAAVGEEGPGTVGTRLPANLAGALTARHRSGGPVADLDEAVRRLEVSLSYEAEGSAMLPLLLSALGSALALRHAATDRPADMERAVAALRSACRLAAELGVETHGAASNWARWAGGRGAWDEVAEAADLGLDSAHRLFRSQLTRAHREARLTEAGRLVAAGAFARTELGDHAGAALLLESGLALQLADTLERERTDLGRLAGKGRGDLAEAYEAAALALSGLERAAARGDGGSAAGEDLTGLLRQRRAELDQVIDEIRGVDGYAGFLTRPRYEDIVEAAAHQPLVYLVSTPWAGRAIIVEGDGEARSVALPALTDAFVVSAVTRLLGSRGIGMRRVADEVTEALGPAVMDPLLTALDGHLGATLVPAGLLSLLPLHAASTGDAASGRRALDSLLLTYAPNARAALVARGWAARHGRPGRLLAVDDPQPGSAPLTTEAEIAAARARFPGHVHLKGADATLDATLAALADCDVAHFACHGVARPDQPLESALLLAGGERLTLRTLVETRVDVRLAVLSACETAVPGLRLPDESTGLPSAFLAAGAAGIIGSLWPVPDASTNLLMAAFYEYWQGDTEPAEALRRAQIWLRSATNREVRERFPHLLTPPPLQGPGLRLWENASEHAPAYCWAGFTYTGS
ncbi:CHAT domain-containing protein [Streptomyces sp. NPDC052299]|uniref:CHAT domain-containing protein n=1 Tax=Streptomyces sp. NPDC052299 TaxID=3155054 RepID=UPI00344667F6